MSCSSQNLFSSSPREFFLSTLQIVDCSEASFTEWLTLHCGVFKKKTLHVANWNMKKLHFHDTYVLDKSHIHNLAL